MNNTDPKALTVLHIQKVTGIAGSENHLLALLPRLSDHGVRPTMLTLCDRTGRSEEFVRRMRNAGVETHRFAVRGLLDPLLVVALARFLGRRRFDLVHTHLVHADIAGGLAARWHGRAPLVSTRHGEVPRRDTLLFRLLLGWNALLPHRMIAISDHIARFTTRFEGVPAERITRIHYGLDPSRIRFDRCWRRQLGIADKSSVVGTVGRLIPEKGHDTLLESFRGVRAEFPDAVLVIAGEGPQRDRLERLTARFGLSGSVFLPGHWPNAAGMMAGFDLYVQPSRSEGFGLVLLEAMAAGLAVVATEAGPMPEIVEAGATGLLTPLGDSGRLGEAIGRLLSNRDLCSRMGRAGRKRLEGLFGVERMASETCRLYRALAPVEGTRTA